MTTPLFLTTDQVAAAIGLASATAFLKIRPRLEVETLFPQPMPTSRRPLRWRADEVAAWVARQGRARAPDAATMDPAMVAAGATALRDIARTA